MRAAPFGRRLWQRAASSGHRYWRLYVTNTSNGSGVAFVEMELATVAAGADTTAGKTATASSEFADAASFAASAIDDNTGTKWASTFAGSWPQWLQVDYGASSGNWLTMHQIKITARTAGAEAQAPGDFKVQYSDDASAWTDVLTQTAQTFTSGETKTYTW